MEANSRNITASRAIPPARQLADALEDGFDQTHAALYTSQLLGALPTVIKADQPGMAWRSALIGPARYPAGYRDVVILAKGRLWPAAVRQRHRDGNIHEDPAAEIDRAYAAAATGIAHGDRAQRLLIPSVLVDGAWLVKAARSHDIPLGPELVASLLEALRRVSTVATSDFRKTLDPAVAKLLRDDESLASFHDWLADEALPAEVRSRRRAAYADVHRACGLLRDRAPVASRLDAGEDALALLAEILDADPAAVRDLLLREPASSWSFEDAQRRAWALEFMDHKMLAGLNGDLDVAGGWAGRLMSFAAVAADDPAERRKLVAKMLERGRLQRYEPHTREFKDWSFEAGRLEFAGLVRAMISFGILPEVLVGAEKIGAPVPTAAEIASSVPALARLIVAKFGIISIETARRRWREIGAWLPKNAAAACHPKRQRWPALVDRFVTDRATIDCLTSADVLTEVVAKLKDRTAVLYEVLAEGCHVLRLRDTAGDMVAVTTVTQDELEQAAARGHVGAADIRRDGWSVHPQWKRWMRVEVGRLINAVAKGKAACDLKARRRALNQRVKTMREIEAMPCGFDHAHAEARLLAREEIAPLLRLLVRKDDDVAAQLFGPLFSHDLLVGVAMLAGEPEPPRTRREPVADPVVSPLLRPVPADFVDPALPSSSGKSSGSRRRSTLTNRHRLLVSALNLPTDLRKTRFIVADVETTGLDVEEDRIIEIAALELLGPDETGRIFHEFVNPGIPIKKEAVVAHGISNAMLRGKPAFAEIAAKFVEFLGADYWFVAHSAEFDVGFINRELERAGHAGGISETRSLCSMKLADSEMGKKSLNDVCGALRIDLTQRKKHGALIDARLCAAVFAKLAFRQTR